MHKNTTFTIFFFIFIIISAISAIADEQSDKKPVASKIKTKFYFQGSYLINFNNPENGRNDYRVFDQKDNTLSIDLLEALVYQEANQDSNFGFRVKVSGGETARYIHARGLGKPGDVIDLTEASLSYAFPGSNGRLKATVGKLCSFIGAEVIEAVDDPNYSRSFLYGYAEPITLTGAKLSYDLSSRVNACLHYVNGWDTFNGSYKSGTVGLNLNVTHSDNFCSSFNILNGPEQNNNTFNNLFLFDWVGTIKTGGNLTFLLNYDYGKQQKALADGLNASWNGFAAIAKYDFTKRFSFALRGEYFNDPEGFRTGTPQMLKEFTLSPQFNIGSNTVLRPEYRYDWSDKNSFNQGQNKSQGTLSLNIMVTY